ncbi:hypothetical protein HK098_005458 [Nowakowskiella sp. JEL0407]|nr:hypothetical protein HK098_005458 [Nowakowskiella sp. JEL0407]
MSLDISALVGGVCPLSNFLISTFQTSPITSTSYSGNVGVASGDFWALESSTAAWTASSSSSWWYANLFSNSPPSQTCKDLSYLSTSSTIAYIGISMSKISSSVSDIEIGLDIGCTDTFQFRSVGHLTPSSSSLTNYAFPLDSFSAADLKAVRAVVMRSGVGKVGIANLQVTCGPRASTSPTTSFLPPATTTSSGSTCSATPLIIHTYDSGSTANLLGGDSGTGGTGSYSVISGIASWTPTISSTTAYWYSNLFPPSAGSTALCKNLSTYGSKAALLINLGKSTNNAAASIEVAVDVGCGSSKVYIPIGTASFAAGVSSKTFVFNIASKLANIEDLSSIKAVVIIATSGNVPSGTTFTIDNVQIICEGSISSTTSTTTIPPSPTTTAAKTTTIVVSTTSAVPSPSTTSVSTTTIIVPTTTSTTKTTTIYTTTKTTTVPSTSPSPPSCPVPTLTVQLFDTTSTTNVLSGDSGTGGTGGYTIADGFATWTPTISTTSAYWYTQLHSASAAAGFQCRNLYSFGSSVAVSITLGKTNAGSASVIVGVDIGCDTKVFKTIGTATFSGVETKTFVFDLLSGVTPTDLQTVKAIVMIANSGSVPSGSVFAIDDVKIVCSGSTTSPLPSPVTSPKTSPTNNVQLCNANGGSIDAAVSGVRPIVASRCQKPGQFALTFDDGPDLYESSLVSQLNSYGVKITFFFNSNNYVNMYNEPYASWVRAAYNSGHQIASHTATHPDLTTLSSSQVLQQMQDAENAINSIIGKRPAMMRPPYGSYNDAVLKVIENAGYKAVIIWNVDTLDWDHNNAQQSMSYIKTAIETNCPVKGSASIIELSHSTTSSASAYVDLLVPYVKNRGYTFVTLSECLGIPAYK